MNIKNIYYYNYDNHKVLDNNNTRIVYFDLLRILATFAIIILHTASANWEKVDVTSYEWSMLNIYDSICRWAVPVFVMISGALMLNKQKSIKNIYTKNVFRIICSFIFWSLIYTIEKHCFLNNTDNIIKNFLIGNYHLWFLYMIAGLYILTPIITKITESEKTTKYFLFISIISTIVLPYIIEIITLFSTSKAEFIQNRINDLNLNMVIGYSLYYILGFYMNKYKIDKKSGNTSNTDGVNNVFGSP